METMSYIANHHVEAFMKPCSYPTTINKHHLCFQSKSNKEGLFAKKRRLSIRKQGEFQVPHCTISSSSSSSSDSKKNDQDDKSFNLDSWLTLFNGYDNETPSKSKDVLLPVLLANDPKKMLLWMVSNAKEYIAKHVELKIKHIGHDEITVIAQWHIGAWKGMGLSMTYELHKIMFLRNPRIVLQPLACLKLKIEEIIVLLLEKIAPSVMHNGMAKAAFFNLLLSLLFMAISLILWMNTSV